MTKVRGWIIAHRVNYWNGKQAVIQCSDIFLEKPQIETDDIRIIEVEVDMLPERKVN